ncbi:hypothetical protein P171DRAFT_499987 [Karstenula rhodostoma CBS 690.94]|uniref:Uncharacterized protein n=1 Tax=Karstenula rhodostoma CBS 690.94 TaxID=1392251 RepID=A0A9P4U8U4_9PLEO|nr:hypothetical protein P171DRAFT_499987 [Karstenula rhodostoma CBS 690.94]
MLHLLLLWYIASGSLTLADPIFETTTSLYRPSRVRNTIIDTATYTRPFNHDAIDQNRILSIGFSKAQSLIASTTDISKRSPTSIPMPNIRRAKHELDELLEEPAYLTMILLVNGYDVTVPILKENATDFCRSVSSKIEGSASDITTSIGDGEPTEAPKTSDASKAADQEPKATEEATSDTETDTPSSSETPSTSKTPTKKPSSTTTADTNAKSIPDHNSTSTTGSLSTADRTSGTTFSHKGTAIAPSITTTEDDAALTTTSSTSSVDDAGKSRDVSQLLADNSKAWASYSSYIDDLHSRLSKRVHNKRTDSPTSTKEPKPAKSPTTSADAPSATRDKVAARQQRQFSQAAGLRDLLLWFHPPFVWRRNGLGYHLHDSAEVEQVQGFSSKSSAKKRHDAAEEQGKLGIMKAHEGEEDDTEPTSIPRPEPTSTKAKDPPKPTFGFDPHPHTPRPSSTPHKSKSHSPTSTGAEPTTTPDLDDSTDPAAPSARPSAGNATHADPDGNSSVGARLRWPKNPFMEPIFWGVGAWYLVMAYWEGYRQARGEVGWGLTDGACRWVGGVMVRYL